MTQSKDPILADYLDEEERVLIESIEAENSGWRPVSQAELKEFQQIAKNTMEEERVRISLRVPKSNLAKIKAKALQEGLPYQTFMNSILHKAVQ